jgi:hypothetical protein
MVKTDIVVRIEIPFTDPSGEIYRRACAEVQAALHDPNYVVDIEGQEIVVRRQVAA